MSERIFKMPFNDQGGSLEWQPQASMEVMRMRASLLADIRAFFADRDVLEVDTPVMVGAATTEPGLRSLCVHLDSDAINNKPGQLRYLQTSPEFAMKRLLAAGSGPIFQIAKAFRDGESGRLHNPEFTMLEWYRPGFDHHALMDEVAALISQLLGDGCIYDRLSYAEIFEASVGINPHIASIESLRQCAHRFGITHVSGLSDHERDAWLDLLLSHVIEPGLGVERPVFVYDYPATQAAFARIRHGDVAIAERFELYINGVELANGYHELTDCNEQQYRFERDRKARRARHLPDVAADRRLLEALRHGLPSCAGVALGLDRLLMIKAGVESISDVLSFPTKQA